MEAPARWWAIRRVVWDKYRYLKVSHQPVEARRSNVEDMVAGPTLEISLVLAELP